MEIYFKCCKSKFNNTKNSTTVIPGSCIQYKLLSFFLAWLLISTSMTAQEWRTIYANSTMQCLNLINDYYYKSASIIHEMITHYKSLYMASRAII